MRVVRMILAIAVLAGSTAAADAKSGGSTTKPSVRAGDTVPDRSNRPHKNHPKGPKGSVCSNGANAKSANCAAPVSPQ